MVSSEYRSYDIKCDLCKQEYNILAKEQDIFDWLAGDKYIQDALDYLSASERELLISRVCDTCWKQLYPDTEEVEDD
tara:strand:+ start:1437 stop:1667 length:231 start_codon:yes stop_codon:yes gene_type:complete